MFIKNHPHILYIIQICNGSAEQSVREVQRLQEIYRNAEKSER